MKKHSFTLIEILAVVAIIGILSTLGFGTYSFAMNKAKESSTQSLIKRIEAGLESCKGKFGYYPASGATHTISVTVTSSTITAISFGNASLNAEYLAEFLKIVEPESFKKMVHGGVLQDAWGNNLYYSYPGDVNTMGYDIVSLGADGQQSATKTKAGYAETDDLTSF